MKNKDYIMRFGEHVDKPLERIPLLYLDWLIGQSWLREDTKEAIENYLSEPAIERDLKNQLAQKERGG